MTLLEMRAILTGRIDAAVWLLEIGGAVGGLGLMYTGAWKFRRAWTQPYGLASRLWSAVQALV